MLRLSSIRSVLVLCVEVLVLCVEVLVLCVEVLVLCVCVLRAEHGGMADVY
jgi:hypothetical protein